MAKAKSTGDLTTAQMALVGYEVEKQRIEQKIREIQALLGGKKAKAVSSPIAEAPRAKRVLSAGARKRIAAAQKKRWAEYRTKKSEAV